MRGWRSRVGVALLLVAGLAVPVAPVAADVHPVIVVAFAGDLPLAHPIVECPVDGSTSPSCTLRAAIEAGNATGEAFEIVVEDVGTITLTSDLPMVTETVTIRGPGSDAVVVDGIGSHALLAMAGAAGLMVAGITLANGRATHGGAISADGVVTVDDDVVFSGNEADENGGAIWLDGGALTVAGDGVRFEGNEAVGRGGAIATETADVEIAGAGVTFVDNGAGTTGGAIVTIDGGFLVSGEDLRFEENTATLFGGAIVAHSPTIAGDRTAFVDNVAGEHGGAIFAVAVSVSGDDVVFEGNVAASGAGGGAIYAEDVEIGGAGVVFEGNRATLGSGGAIHNFDGGGTSLLGSGASFVDNDALDDGGAIYTTSGAVEVSGAGAIFEGNVAGSVGGAVHTSTGPVTVSGDGAAFVENEAFNDDGGAIRTFNGDIVISGDDVVFEGNHADHSGGAIRSANGTVTVAGSGAVFSSNSVSSTHGGAISTNAGPVAVTGEGAVFDGNVADSDGGAIQTISGPITISGEGATFTGNVAAAGGAIRSSSGTVRVESGALLDGNEATSTGGAIRTGSSDVVVIGSSILDNVSAVNGGGVYTFSGAIFVIESTIARNEAEIGAAIRVGDPAGEVVVVNSTLSGNTAELFGGAIATEGDVELLFSTVAGNSAPGGGQAFHGFGGGSFDLTATIVADGVGSLCLAGVFVSNGWNVAEDGSCGLTEPTDQVALAELGPLADNGGPTLTHALAQISPALDVVPEADCTALLGADPVDQRDVPRPQGPACDAGAFERAVVDEVVVVPSEVTIEVGASTQLTAIAHFGDGTSFPVTVEAAWASDDTDVVTVDMEGLATGVGTGTASVTATFEGQLGAATVTVVEPICPDGLPLPFDDVDPGAVHAASIACVAHHGIAGGFGDGTYRPSQPVRRGQMASFVVQALEAAGYTLPAPTDHGFTDLAGNVHADSINRLVAAEIVGGTSATTFSPGGFVRRAQMASFLVGAVEWALAAELEPVGGPHFTDIADNVHAENIDLAFELGLTAGTGDGLFAPSAPVNRAPMASFLVNLLDVVWPE